MITCHKCGSTNVTHYRQKRKDGEWVVTARCENGHIPEKGKPFYPKYQFDIPKLPPLPGHEGEQMVFETPAPIPSHSIFGDIRTKYDRMMGVK
jgi:hypothetical protein